MKVPTVMMVTAALVAGCANDKVAGAPSGKATRIKMPVSLWGDRESPVRLVFKDCEIGFSVPQKEFNRGAYISAVELDNVKVSGDVNGPLVRLWRADESMPAVRVHAVTGLGQEVRPTDAAWAVRGI